PEVRFDQLLLRLFVSLVLAAGQLTLLGGRQERAVADRADVELERILRRRRGLGRLAPVVLVGVLLRGLGQQLEPRLCRRVIVGRKTWERPLLHHRKGYRPVREEP